jgi:glycosyltransferase 2 family protein
MSAPQLSRGDRVRSWLPKLLVSLLISVGLVWMFRSGGLPLVPASEQLASTSVPAVAGYVTLQGLATVFRTYRWNHLLAATAKVSDPLRVLGIGLIGYTTILFAPLRLGEAMRPWLLAQDGEVGFIQAAGTISAERIIDGITLAAVLLVGMLLSTQVSPLPDHVGRLAIPVGAIPTAATLTCAVFIVGFLAMLLFHWHRQLARRLVELPLSWLSRDLAEWVGLLTERLAEGLRFLSSSRATWRFLRDTCVYWACGTFSTWTLLRGVGIDATLAEACVVIGVTGLGTLLPSGPGFFGTYQLGTYAALAMFYPEEIVLTRGALFAFWSYALVLTVSLVSCLAGVLILRARPLRAGSKGTAVGSGPAHTEEPRGT